MNGGEIAMYEITHTNDRKLIIAENQHWTDEDCKRLLKEENIVYRKGVFAVEIIPRKFSKPLLKLGMEDDGIISFGNDDITFDASWAEDLIKTVTEAAMKDIDMKK